MTKRINQLDSKINEIKTEFNDKKDNQIDSKMIKLKNDLNLLDHKMLYSFDDFNSKFRKRRL